MSLATISELHDALQAFHLLEPAQLEALMRTRERFRDPRVLAQALIRRGWLTAYQVNTLAHGNGADLLVSSYVIRERLGEGGMGTVFKARHWKLGQVVALKVMRKDRSFNANAVRRFSREVQAAARLPAHPNVVAGFDAGQVGDTLYFAMEYAEGTDLARLVRQLGPLPVEQACVYVRQAALGLQHAHEHGLIHRDIKPSNLMQTTRSAGRGQPADFVVKILDMGLARLLAADDDSLSELTQEGTVVGTLDYMAPEQAQDARQVDTRADLYSLGCTFYFLLTGQPPFPGGSAPHKLLKHRLDPPPPVKALRPDVPAAVATIVHKLLAKRPEDRFQTPAELASQLHELLAAGDVQLDTKRRPGSIFKLIGGLLVVVLLVLLLVRWGPEKQFTNSIGMKLALIPAGKFVMGSPDTEAERAAGENAHAVEITRPFYLTVYPVTQDEYQKVVNANPSHFSASGAGQAMVAGIDTGRFPVENVTFEDAMTFCQKLSERPEEKSRKRFYRLPTEAEWEYAARAGTTTAFSCGDSLSSVQANFNGASPYGGAPGGAAVGRPTSVGSYPPNPWGLFDMHGNVWQWTNDWYDPNYYPISPRQDPTGPKEGPATRAMRGGSYDSSGGNCRSAFRTQGAPTARWPDSGFRIGLDVPR